jgi:hypothetical protein
MTPTNTQGSEQELVQSLIDFAWPEVVGRYTYDTLPPNSKAHVDKMLALIKSDREARLPSIPSVNDAWCVACGHPTLILGNGGYITCSLEGCPDPAATHDRLTQLSKEEKQS